VLIGAGNRVPVPGRGDRTYPFRAHSEYVLITDDGNEVLTADVPLLSCS